MGTPGSENGLTFLFELWGGGATGRILICENPIPLYTELQSIHCPLRIFGSPHTNPEYQVRLARFSNNETASRWNFEQSTRFLDPREGQPTTQDDLEWANSHWRKNTVLNYQQRLDLGFSHLVNNLLLRPQWCHQLLTLRGLWYPWISCISFIYLMQ